MRVTQRGSARRRRRPRLVALARVLIAVAAVLAVLPVLAIVIYRVVDPPYSMPMLRQMLTGQPVRQHWVPLERISPQLRRAVVVSEDARFCRHAGVDWTAIDAALEEAERGSRPRGASTLTMQTVKNLLLWSQRSYLRKAVEIPLAYVMDFAWPKRRVLEVYLNIAEWGPGIFGAEAAARYHFRKSAAALTRGEAALLAAALPNPLVRNAGKPGPLTRRLAARLERRMLGAGAVLGCLASGA